MFLSCHLLKFSPTKTSIFEISGNGLANDIMSVAVELAAGDGSNRVLNNIIEGSSVVGNSVSIHVTKTSLRLL
jgi:hypothetical protein